MKIKTKNKDRRGSGGRRGRGKGREMAELGGGCREYIDKKGCLKVKLRKALYRCVESAGSWYGHLSGTLESEGYVSNQYDHCVYNKSVVHCTPCKFLLLYTQWSYGFDTYPSLYNVPDRWPYHRPVDSTHP
jgi:hypothetical protein